MRLYLAIVTAMLMTMPSMALEMRCSEPNSRASYTVREEVGPVLHVISRTDADDLLALEWKMAGQRVIAVKDDERFYTAALSEMVGATYFVADWGKSTLLMVTLPFGKAEMRELECRRLD